MARQFVFLINLVQDVGISRPIVEFASREFDHQIVLMVTSAFTKRDATGLWAQEIAEMASAFGARVVDIATPADALKHLLGNEGLILASSETDLPAHQICNDIFRVRPSSFLTMTFQHGFECPGFLHNAAHDKAHGVEIGFGANVIVGWFGGDTLYSIKPSERPKLYVAGPPMLLSRDISWPPKTPRPANDRPLTGLVCENLHSVRLREEDTRSAFIETFRQFATDIADIGGSVELRPHPGGRFTERNKVEFPGSVVRNTAPLYKQQLDRFHFGISAPSSVLFDLILADVPVAVWQNPDESIDLSNYAGLPVIRHGSDWWAFAMQAHDDPVPLLARQHAFVDSLNMPGDVARRYRSLLSANG